VQTADLQSKLAERNIDGWLFCDFHHRNFIAYRTLGLRSDLIATRRWYYYVPQRGEPQALVSALEAHNLDSLPGKKRAYRTWEERRDWLEETLPHEGTVAMEYSPLGAIPYVSLIDAGTVDLVRSFGTTVVSSADLVQMAVSRWSDDKWSDHLAASSRLIEIKDRAFAEIASRLSAGKPTTDYDIQQLMCEWYDECGLVSDDPPIVSTNAHCSDPHYLPTDERQTPIQMGDVLLIDLWARLDSPGSVYADYTWTAYAGEQAPERVARVFTAVASARDSAIKFVTEQFARGTPIRGWQVDDVARQSIERSGFGEYFIHRTGHNINEDVHGEGANMDNYETRDERTVLERTCFSIEPGIYLPEFGIRSEVDVFIAAANEVVVTGVPIQTSLLALFDRR
jgi:Xaa-Pro aminopeptidase